MNRLHMLIIALLFGVAIFLPNSSYGGRIAGVDIPMSPNVPEGVYCKINEVTVIAQNVEDCNKAGGVVTHKFKTVVEPVENEN